MTEEVRNISVNVRATQAISALTKMGVSLDNLNGASGKSDAELRKVDRAIAKAANTALTAAKTVGSLKQELRDMSRTLTMSNSEVRKLTSRLSTANKTIAAQKETIRVARQIIREMTTANGQLEESYDGVARGARNAAKAQAQLQTLRPATQQGPATNFGMGLPILSMEASLARNGAGTALANITREANAAQKAGKSAAKAMKDLDESFQENALRYALYDVANSLGRIRDVGVRALGDLLKTGIDFERNFANVIRTSQVNDITDGVTAVRLLEEAFLDLQSTLPVTSEELTRIGTLSAQMGIASGDVARFTEITAKFAATSGISADESATALARVSQILATDVQGNYERLASAILKTGVNAIATEQQIVRGTTQIASVGKVAGFSATEVIALSSAMSSLGMSPELQRSVITSSFTRILTAVRASSAEAEKFGVVLGMTGEEFQRAWEGDGYNTYRRLLAAIADSPNAIGTLQDLQLASQRLTPNLLKLGQSYELLGETMRDTQQGWDEQQELERQYSIISETTAAAIQKLSGAWDAFLQIIGADAVSILGDVAEGLADMLRGWQDWARTDIGKNISNLVIVLGLLLTFLSGLLTAVTLAGGAVLGFDFVVKSLGISLAQGTGLLGGFKANIDRVAASSTLARTAISALGVATKALGAALSIFALVTIAPQLLQSLREMTDITPGLDDATKALTNFNKAQITLDLGLDKDAMSREMEQFGAILDGTVGNSLRSYEDQDWFSKFFFDVSGLNNVVDTVGKYDTALAALVTSGNAQEAAEVFQFINEGLIAQGNEANEVPNFFPEYLASVGMAAGATAEEMDTYHQGVAEGQTVEERAALRAASMASALGLTTQGYKDAETALAGYLDAFKSGAGSFFDVGSLLGEAFGTEDGQGGGLARFQADLDAQLAAARTWEAGLSELSIRGAGALTTAFAAAGPSSQAAIAEALTLGPEALARLERSMAEAAFFASDEYAAAFGQNNAILADVYRAALAIDPATALDAVNEARLALQSTGGILDAPTIAALQNKFGFKLDVSLGDVSQEDVDRLTAFNQSGQVQPVRVPVSLGYDSIPDADVVKTVDAFKVSFQGKSITIPVDPSTEEGTQMINDWLLSDAFNPANIITNANTDPATETLRLFRLAQANNTIWLNARVRSVGGSQAAGPQTDISRAKGGPIPGYSRGTLAGPLRGPGTTTSDSILARLSVGEYVHNAKAVRYYGPAMMDDINRMRFPKFATGGGVGYGPGNPGGNAGSQVNVSVVQNYPQTVDPIKDLREKAEQLVSGIWG